ncbi:DedA family protein [Pelotomaculum propionicicum]|uniref:Inner membrane protein YghB n=1 Tax=Pelotomaculum propionicicum TaxID=258475 RepID=A0A4Y7RQH3_9FIRM|nr:DedA family protein [Pelotomaculum propionicicum]NLI14194.1 DedA family protein [Peptococcaceae bacterium]TEB11245.1 Inner membrane protein YghB [Pelotomaculum propionicicum]
MFDLILDYLSKLGLGGLLAGVFIEALGLPFPGGIMVMVTGILVEQGRINFVSALAITLCGYSAGAMTAYLIGRYLGQPFFIKCGKLLHISPGQFEKAQTWLDRSAPAFIVFGRFLPGLSNLTPYMAGVSRIGAGFFLFYNSIFTLGWGVLYLTVGMFFGHNYQLIAYYLNSKLPFVGLGALALYFIYHYLKRYIKKGVKNI